MTNRGQIHMSYKYKMVQAPKNLHLKNVPSSSGVAEGYLQAVVDQYATDGWEFYRVDDMTVATSPGCLGALTGQKETYTVYNVITFRREG